MTKTPVNQWVYYKHSNSDGQAFTLEKITHSDVLMRGGGLKDNMNIEIKQNGALFVYYNDQNAINEPRVICISKNGPSDTANNSWYIAGSDECSWVFQSNGINNKKNPTEVTADDLGKANAQNISISETTNYVIKVDKRPEGVSANKKIKYRTGDKEFTVERKDGNPQGTDGVPADYVRYKHSPADPQTTTFDLNLVKHNDQELKGVVTGGQTQGVEAVYVYYEKNNDQHHQFPLIVCVSAGSSSHTYYERGNTWKTISELNNKDPERLNTNELGTLGTKLGDVKDKFEIKLEKDNSSGGGKYKARPTDTDQNITVSPVNHTTYKGFKHDLGGTDKKINRITIHGHITDGIEDSVLTSQQFNTTGGVFVYFEINDANTKREKPLLICLSQDGRANATTNKWYKRKPDMTWQEETTGYDQIPPGPSINPTLKGKLGTIKGELNPRGNKDTGYLNFASHFNSHINP